MKTIYRTACLAFLLAFSTVLGAQDVVISEFLASNGNGIQDPDGGTPDWVELYNTTDAVVSLEGWHLTDSADTPDKWTFPAGVEIAPGGFFVVFTSGTDQKDPAEALHTNFKLDSDGEFLALVTPDGTLSTVFSPTYPEQRPDISYGAAMTLQRTTLVTDDEPLTWLVPADGTLGSDWIATDFDDQAWTGGQLPIGFDQKSNPNFEDVIKTDIGEAMRRVNASVYVRVPFEVVDADVSVDLSIQYDDGFIAYLNGEEIARRNAPDDADWESDADGSQSTAGSVSFEKIPVPGAQLQQGVNVLAVHHLNSTVTGSDCILRVRLDSTKLESVDLATRMYFPEPSPGGPNNEGLDRVAPKPEFSTQGGMFVEDFDLELSVPEEGFEIRYTTNNSEPTESSTLYEGPISIDRVITIKAMAFGEGAVPSKREREQYLPAAASLLERDSNLPIVVIAPRSGIGADSFQNAVIAVLNSDTGERNSFSDDFNQSGTGGIRVHGSSSSGFPKRNYRIEFQDAAGLDSGKKFLGLPKAADWVIHGPYSDKSLMRNALSYGWANQIGWIAPQTQFFELYLNSNQDTLSPNDYAGVYLAVQRVKRSENFVDIAKILPTHNQEPEISGGYILKKDRLDPGDAGLRTSRGQVLGWVEPKEREVSSQQRSWMRNYFNQFEAALYGADFADPELGYAAYIDVPSWIDHHILVELCKQIDGYRLSTHMYKDRGGKIVMGPCWDYNLSLGNADYLNGFNPQGWYYPQLNTNDYPWYPRLFADPNFSRRYRLRWAELRGSELATEKLNQSIDAYHDLLGEASARNFQKWRVLGTRLWPNWFIARTWDEEIDWMRNTWLANRVEWMDSQLGIPGPELSVRSGIVDSGTPLEMTASIGEVYYTVNGPDPRSENGDLAPEAIKYSGPLILENNPVVRARSKYGDVGWTDMSTGAYVTDPLPIVLTEVHFNPIDEDDEFRGSDFEFLEFKNIGTDPIDLSKLKLDDLRVKFDFAASKVQTLEPGAFVLVVNNEAAFAKRYGEGLPVAGEFSSALSNNSMSLEVYDEAGLPMVNVTYDDWYAETDGDGYSLVIRDENGPLSNWDLEEGWRPSMEIHGSPGRDDSEGAPGLQLPGDINQDAAFNISDAVAILGFLFTGVDASPCSTPEGNLLVLDVNGDESGNLTDAVHVLNYLFRTGSPPALGTACVAIVDCPTVCTN